MGPGYKIGEVLDYLVRRYQRYTFTTVNLRQDAGHGYGFKRQRVSNLRECAKTDILKTAR